MNILQILTFCFGSSKDLSHCDGSFDYPHYMLWLRNKIFLITCFNKRAVHLRQQQYLKRSQVIYEWIQKTNT